MGGLGMTPMINVVCCKVRPPERLPRGVRNHGYHYTPEFVNRLKNMVKRNLSLDHVFCCITDDPTGLDPEIVPIDAPGLPGWWNKMKAFDPKEIFAQRIMVLDLDVLVVDDLEPIAMFPAAFATVKQWKRITSPKTIPRYQGSVYVFDKGARSRMWTDLQPDTPERFRSDQDWLAHLYPNESTFPPGWVRKMHVDMTRPPPGTRVLLCQEMFGQGKNDIAAERMPWVKEIWQ